MQEIDISKNKSDESIILIEGSNESVGGSSKRTIQSDSSFNIEDEFPAVSNFGLSFSRKRKSLTPNSPLSKNESETSLNSTEIDEISLPHTDLAVGKPMIYIDHQLKNKIDINLMISTLTARAIKKSLKFKNTIYRQIVSQENLPKTKKKQKNLNEVESILQEQGYFCKAFVNKRIHEFELDAGISVILGKNNNDVIEWISALPKALTKKNELIISEADIPDQMFVPKYRNKRRKLKCAEETQVRYILIKQLEEFDHMSHDMAKAIAFKYPALRKLREAIVDTPSNPEEFLSKIVYKPNHTRMQKNWKQIGPAASKKIYNFLTCTDPVALI
ncbi:hypothetical protein HZS_3782 [Henneguya salminicola]|nr:hypothetical protein HZS_3782 [Henneguya salminicola]